MNESFLRLPEVQRRTGLSRARIYAFIQQGTFPKQRAIAARAVAWLESEIDQWIAQRVGGAK